uniref:hypoxia-inducible factor-proline dioxygenase n=1 Tax=Phallusia mammillata TaxID=59560 RepID=A0A6F9DBK4_9ASCI|nr:egl nine homolog 1 [Phallusia mammillata]
MSSQKCQVCDSEDKLQWCSKCHSAAYCSREHQKQDWKAHKKACKKIVQLKEDTNGLENSIREGISNLSVQNGESSATTSALNDANPEEPNEAPAVQSSKLWAAQNSVKMDPFNKSDVTEVDEQKARAIWSDMEKMGICMFDNFLPEDQAEMLLNDVKGLYSKPGHFADGEIVRQGSNLGTTRIRSDRITWVDETVTKCEGVRYLCKQMDKFVHLCSQIGDCRILSRTKPMVSCYPANGTHYKRHVDNPAKDGRILTCLYYLNKDWITSRDGGALCIYPTCLNQKKVVCEPKFNRVILFFSDNRNPHEVMPTHRERFAITCWYFDYDERLKALDAWKQNNAAQA